MLQYPLTLILNYCVYYQTTTNAAGVFLLEKKLFYSFWAEIVVFSMQALQKEYYSCCFFEIYFKSGADI